MSKDDETESRFKEINDNDKDAEKDLSKDDKDASEETKGDAAADTEMKDAATEEIAENDSQDNGKPEIFKVLV